MLRMSLAHSLSACQRSSAAKESKWTRITRIMLDAAGRRIPEAGSESGWKRNALSIRHWIRHNAKMLKMA